MYTPKGKIILKQDPSTELISSVTGNRYTGPYKYNTVTGEYFDETGQIQLTRVGKDTIPKQEDVALIPTKYDLIKKDTQAYNLRGTRAPQPYLPIPVEQDYQAGAINRYFLQHKQTGDVLEVSRTTFSKVKSKSTEYHYPSYLVGSTVWFLRGPVANQDVNGYIVLGTASKNEDVIRVLEQTLPNIRTYLTDPTQFVK